MELSLRWAERARVAFAERAAPGQALFGIVQGGVDAELRRRSAEALVGMDFPGYGIGGLAVGEGQELMLRTLDGVLPILPADKPRYLMGVGTPSDLIESVARGVDMFDCVLPTRNGRHGLAFTWNGKVNLRNAMHAEDAAPLDPESACPAARDYSRAYLHHLVQVGRVSRRHAAVVGQHGVLSGADGGHARRHRRRPLRSWADATLARMGGMALPSVLHPADRRSWRSHAPHTPASETLLQIDRRLGPTMHCGARWTT